MTEERCEFCKFWDATRIVGAMADCRRFPPGCTGMMTMEDDWCGEFRAILPPPTVQIIKEAQ